MLDAQGDGLSTGKAAARDAAVYERQASQVEGAEVEVGNDRRRERRWRTLLGRRPLGMATQRFLYAHVLLIRFNECKVQGLMAIRSIAPIREQHALETPSPVPAVAREVAKHIRFRGR